MNNFWKGVSLTLVLLFGFILAYNIYFRTTQPKGNGQEYDNQVAAYNEYLSKQAESNEAYMLKTNQEFDRVKGINSKAAENNERFEKILKKWEEQANRFDKVLDRLEERL